MKSIIKLVALFVVLFTCSAAYADPLFVRPIDRSHLTRPTRPMGFEVLVEIDIAEEALSGEVMDGMTCEEWMAYTAAFATDRDTDLDGISDYHEMSIIRRGVRFGGTGLLRQVWAFDPVNADCSCDNTLTCWYVMDTDADGLIDSKDGYYWESIRSQIYGLDGTEPITERIVRLSDHDGDGIPVMRDRDSDDDGLDDGEEDRSVLFDYSAESYLSSVFGGLDHTWYRDSSGERVACELDSHDRRIGISHHIYEIRSSFAPARRFLMSCVNETVSNGNSFNGNLDYYDRSSYYSADTDGDGFCDGTGPACEGRPMDICPKVPAGPGSIDGC